VRHRLEQSTNDPGQKAIIDQFFGSGISGVIRYLLVGPVVVPQHGNLLRQRILGLGRRPAAGGRPDRH
jgi:hypothetical protein